VGFLCFERRENWASALTPTRYFDRECHSPKILPFQPLFENASGLYQPRIQNLELVCWRSRNSRADFEGYIAESLDPAHQMAHPPFHRPVSLDDQVGAAIPFRLRDHLHKGKLSCEFCGECGR
jgi:hypothetical protein